MNTITPIPIILPAQERSKCPACKADEDIVEVCAHCGHKYIDEPTRWYHVFCGIIMILFVIWALITVISWLFDNSTYGGEKRSLWEIIVMQWDFVKSLRIW